MTDLQNNLEQVISNERIKELEEVFLTTTLHLQDGILEQKEVFKLLGIDSRRLNNWVEQGLGEMRIDDKYVYYLYSDLMKFIEN